jgi:hypothetical protein
MMKKIVVLAIIVFAMSGLIFCENFSVNLNISYNYGTSGFFGKSQQSYFIGGENYLETIDSRMGIGFNVSINIPLVKRLYLVPGFSLNFGHQQYTFANQDDPGANSQNETSYFHIYSPEISLLYDLFNLKNGWKLDLLAGLTYSTFKADAEMKKENTDFWGLQMGVGARFLQLKHFGFQLFGYYRMPFKSDLYGYIGSMAGISYRF